MILFVKHLIVRLSKNKFLLIRIIALFIFLISLLFLFQNYFHTGNTVHIKANLSDLKYHELFEKLNPYIEDWGQFGGPVYLSKKQKVYSDKLFKLAAFNVYISDRIR